MTTTCLNGVGKRGSCAWAGTVPKRASTKRRDKALAKIPSGLLQKVCRRVILASSLKYAAISVCRNSPLGGAFGCCADASGLNGSSFRVLMIVLPSNDQYRITFSKRPASSSRWRRAGVIYVTCFDHAFGALL